MDTNLIKIILSLALSLIIGLEREYQNKSAGLRTSMLVCLGTTLFAIIGLQFGTYPNADITRLFYAPIIGIGFLGSGVIIQKKGNLEGITTASVLWSLVAIGLLCGIAEFELAIISTLCIFTILMLRYIKIKFNLIVKKKRRKK